MFDLVSNWLQAQGMEGWTVVYASWAVAVLAVLFLAVIANYVAKKILLGLLSVLIKRTRTRWDDALLERRVLHRASHVAPALVCYWLAAAFPGLESLIERLATVYILAVSGLVASALMSAVVDIYSTMEIGRNRPIKGFVQLGKILLSVVVTIVCIAVLFEQSPFGLLGGLGALTAVLMLVFKDTILGLVASFQIATTKVVQIGDWVEMPRYGADGDVIDISLHTIQVQNWDKTISSIPTYAFVSDSFKNWRGMSESGGRRIKRAISIDMNSVRFCTVEMIERFSRFEAIADYIQRKKEELAAHNTDHKVDTTFLVNGRHMTNLGSFRAYLEAYLRRHSKIHQDMTLLVRQLAPGEHGLPIEIYVFSNVQEWAAYESIQADIFDHILAVLPLFDLQVFQQPGGSDLKALAGIGQPTP